jgi:hypothetical protein
MYQSGSILVTEIPMQHLERDFTKISTTSKIQKGFIKATFNEIL